MKESAASDVPPPPAPRSILVLCTRRLGDLLLTTALLRSLRLAWPGVALDVLTLQWSAPALAGNPDVRRVIAIPERAGVRDTLRAVGPPRRYDLALATLASDRTHFLAGWAAGYRVGLLSGGHAAGAWWKRRLASRHAALDVHSHMVVQYLRLASLLEIPVHHDLVPPRAPPHGATAQLRGPYAVVHPAPMYAYKRWHLEGWGALMRWLLAQGLQIAVTGGPGEGERRYVAELLDRLRLGPGITNLVGQLGFPQLTPLIEGAAVYAGPDTSVTHLAAATGAPVVTPYGPTGPVVWGPWPKGLREVADSPWRMTAPLQQRGNVWIVQGLAPCMPCQREGCERHLDSRADCLATLPAARMIAAAEQALRRPRALQV